uniref:Uncharacterized protein n=1 Tax=Rhizophora mucronata TaxID=61149 RepID=A0A2P2ISB1_RHIMU
MVENLEHFLFPNVKDST